MRKRLTPGLVLGTIAVIIACSGSAVAGTLITGAKIKDGTITAKDIKKGTISSDRLASSVRKQMAKAGTPGAKGDKGDTGATGATVQASAPQQGQKGDTGAAGPAGKDGVNPASLVAASGDNGWATVGGGRDANNPKATIAGGELRLAGGFDSDTPAGAIGFMHTYANLPLSSLKSLSYDFHVSKRPAGNTVSAPTIHVTVDKAATGVGTGFANFVFEPYNQTGSIDLNQPYSMDAISGLWWATKDLPGLPRQQTTTWAELLAKNPDATISAISIDNGGSSAGTIVGDNFAAGADNLLVGFNSSFTRYDFGG
jgi:hypothetical protein